ncbi:MAG: glycosyltransferase [Candidatus Nanopelagicales bacterium]|nr:glycosyltransferase [Candidatus Nanopelagicales bacterium]
MKVLHVSTYDAHGGAGRAAFALHTAMRARGVDSSMLVAEKSSSDPQVIELTGAADRRWRAAQFADRRLWDMQRSPNPTWRSPARFGALDADAINASDADIVNLHWVTNGFLTIKQIGRITKPVVWSLYDMWVMAGSEHYGVDTDAARWLTGYTARNRAPGDRGVDLELETWNRKLLHWTTPRHLVPASSWLAACARDSLLTRSWPITRIAHVIDTEAFAPMPQDQARALHALPPDAPIVLFLSSGGVADRRKGWDLLASAMQQVRSAVPGAQVVVAGPRGDDAATAALDFVHWVGEISGNEQLRALYAAADVVAVPSREDNMPLTAMEAQSVGIPVAAFDIGGLPDIVEHGVTGMLAAPFDVDELAAGIIEALTTGRLEFGAAARAHALATWSPEVVVARYLEVYAQELAQR